MLTPHSKIATTCLNDPSPPITLVGDTSQVSSESERIRFLKRYRTSRTSRLVFSSAHCQGVIPMKSLKTDGSVAMRRGREC